MSEIQDKLQMYSAKLDELQKKCAEAERDAIVAETNLKNCVQRKETLVEELEALANCSFDEIPAILQKEESELDSIMQRIMKVNISGPITQDTLDQLNSIINDFSIQALTN